LGNNRALTQIKPLDQSDKPKLALDGKAVHAGMGTKYKSTGAQPAMVSYRLQ